MLPTIKMVFFNQSYTVSTYFIFNTLLTFASVIVVSAYYLIRKAYGRAFTFFYLLIVIIAGYLGVKLLHFVVYYHPGNSIIDIFAHPFGQYITAGAFFLVIPLIILAAWWKKRDFWELLDIMTPGTTLGLTFSKIGCFLSSCCFGVPTRLPWAVVFPYGSQPYYYYGLIGIPIHPVQIYESFFNFLLFLLSVALFKRGKVRNGTIFLLFFFFYNLYRAIVASIRAMPSSAPPLFMEYPFLLNLSFLLVALAALIILIARFKNKPKTGEDIE